MDYAGKILRKYGWKEGKGLGKDEKGIAKPIKCELKFDKSGIGYNEKISKDENNQWWIEMFNRAAANIPSSSVNDNGKTKKSKSKSNRDEEVAMKVLTDEELFKACGGRTAHKAARHGFTLNGKLERVHQQEAVNEGKVFPNEFTNQKELEFVTRRKKEKLKSLSVTDIDESVIDETNPQNKKKKKTKSKCHLSAPVINDLPFRDDEKLNTNEGETCEKLAFDSPNMMNFETTKRQKTKRDRSITNETLQVEINSDTSKRKKKKRTKE